MELNEKERMFRSRGINRKIKDSVQTQLAHEETERRYDLRHKRYSPSFDIGQRVYKGCYRQSSARERFNAKFHTLRCHSHPALPSGKKVRAHMK